MKIIKAFSVIYNLFATQKLQNKLNHLGLDDLEKIDDLMEKLDKTSDKFYLSMDENLKKQQLITTLYFISKYMVAMNRGEFKDAFDIAQQGYSSSNIDGLKQAFMVNSVDALTMIKSHLSNDDEKKRYQQIYGLLENHYMNLLEDLENHQAVERLAKINTSKTGMAVQYNGSYMALAYLNHLNGQEEKAQEFMTKLINVHGVDVVEEMEAKQIKGNGFFYRHCNEEYRQFTENSCEQFRQKQEKKQSMRI